jgi:hypothetical protein
MIYKSLAVFCLLNKVVIGQELPPSDGKYFYADYKSSTQYGVKYVDMQMSNGNTRRKMNVFVTSNQ